MLLLLPGPFTQTSRKRELYIRSCWQPPPTPLNTFLCLLLPPFSSVSHVSCFVWWMSNQVNTRGRGYTRTHTAQFTFYFFSFPLPFWQTLIHMVSSSHSHSSVLLFPLASSAYRLKQQRSKVVQRCNYLSLVMHNFFFCFLHSQITLSVLVCVFVREKESSLSPLGPTVSLIKDRRLMERECVARLACRPRQQHTTLAVWRDGAKRRECVGVCVMVGGLSEGKR